MKKVFLSTVFSCLFLGALTVHAQEDKSKRPSQPAKAMQTIATGTVITIDYSQPLLKGRTMGKDIEPKKGKVWRAGANEATTFEVSNPVTIEGKALPAGKYAFFTIDNGDEWTLIFNKTANQWGAYEYKEAEDALRVKVKPLQKSASTEKLTYSIDKSGKVTLNWGTVEIPFSVK